MPCPEFFVAPVRQELRGIGIRERRTPDEADAAVAHTPGALMIASEKLRRQW